MELPQRKIIRLQDYDYSMNGAYFVTICTYERQNLFGKICRGDPCGRPSMKYSQLGEIAIRKMTDIEKRYNISVIQYIVMPNHIHAIILICDNVNVAGDRKGRPYSLPQIVGGYKSLVTNDYLKLCKQNNVTMGNVWQRSYYERIIRNQYELDEIRRYIYENPLKLNGEDYFDY